MIKKCDNTEYFKWIEMSDPIFEDMNIDISKIHFYMDMESNKYLMPDSSGRASQMVICDYNDILNFKIIRNGFIIQICYDLLFDEFIQTYSHEVGHVTQKCGYFENTKGDVISKYREVISESIALKFEKKFLIKFNKKYDTNIPIDTVFNKSKNKKANYLKKFFILITKSEYKLKNDNHF